MTNDAFRPLLVTTDWNEEWKALQHSRERADDPAIWDEKAKTYPVKHGSQAGYVANFLELAAIEPGETVLDMGCGTGSLATPLAQMGHRVIACDFSHGMLDVMRADQESLGVEGVEVHELSWMDDFAKWEAEGLVDNSVDVAIASRSIATDDMLDALLKLDRVARRRVCVTLSASASPHVDDTLMRAAGVTGHLGHDFLYAFNILAQQGIYPEVAYIPNVRLERFKSPDDAFKLYVEAATAGARGYATADEVAAIPANLRRWLDESLVFVDGAWQLAEPRNVVWAFIAWSSSR